MPSNNKKNAQPPQKQARQPGLESEMHPPPESEGHHYRAAGKLRGKTAIVSGGDSGIGKATAILFAKEGADVTILYLDETTDAARTRTLIEKEGRRCVAMAGDIADRDVCHKAVKATLDAFGKIDIVVNNAAEQHEAVDFADISPKQLERTFRTNVYGTFFLTQAALPHLREGSCILVTTSITAFRGHPTLVDYAATKGALLAFLRSLSSQLVKKGIRVNGVAPGPIWTPLIPASFEPDHVAQFGTDTPMGRPGQPDEVAACFVFLASDDAAYLTGQVLHPNGGSVVA